MSVGSTVAVTPHAGLAAAGGGGEFARTGGGERAPTGGGGLGLFGGGGLGLPGGGGLGLPNGGGLGLPGGGEPAPLGGGGPGLSGAGVPASCVIAMVLPGTVATARLAASVELPRLVTASALARGTVDMRTSATMSKPVARIARMVSRWQGKALSRCRVLTAAVLRRRTDGQYGACDEHSRIVKSGAGDSAAGRHKQGARGRCKMCPQGGTAPHSAWRATAARRGRAVRRGLASLWSLKDTLKAYKPAMMFPAHRRRTVLRVTKPLLLSPAC